MHVWHHLGNNLNITFNVAEQCLDSKSTFENGTTATLIPLYDPETSAQSDMAHWTTHETIPYIHQPLVNMSQADVVPSTTQSAELSRYCRWQLQQIAMDQIPGLERLWPEVGECPAIDEISLHKPCSIRFLLWIKMSPASMVHWCFKRLLIKILGWNQARRRSMGCVLLMVTCSPCDSPI